MGGCVRFTLGTSHARSVGGRGRACLRGELWHRRGLVAQLVKEVPRMGRSRIVGLVIAGIQTSADR